MSSEPSAQAQPQPASQPSSVNNNQSGGISAPSATFNGPVIQGNQPEIHYHHYHHGPKDIVPVGREDGVLKKVWPTWYIIGVWFVATAILVSGDALEPAFEPAAVIAGQVLPEIPCKILFTKEEIQRACGSSLEGGMFFVQRGSVTISDLPANISGSTELQIPDSDLEFVVKLHCAKQRYRSRPAKWCAGTAPIVLF